MRASRRRETGAKWGRVPRRGGVSSPWTKVLPLNEVILVLQSELNRAPVAGRLVRVVGIVGARRVNVLEEALQRGIEEERAPTGDGEERVHDLHRLVDGVRRVVAEAEP